MTDLLDLLPMGAQIDDLNHRTIYVNQKFTQMLGYTLDDIADPEDWFRLAYPDPEDREIIRNAWQNSLSLAEATQTDIPVIERSLTCKDGKKKVIEFHIRRIGDYYLYLNTDVSATHRMADDLRRMAYTDSLTEVSNRRHFFEIGDKLVATQRDSLVAFMFDLDHFKSLNDQYGHRLGDQVLIEVAGRCRAALRSTDYIARLGGEEFGVLLPFCNRNDAREIAERLRRSVAETPVAARYQAVNVTISIGIAFADRAGIDIDTLMTCADQALYAAKHAGRNRVRFYTENTAA